MKFKKFMPLIMVMAMMVFALAGCSALGGSTSKSGFDADEVNYYETNMGKFSHVWVCGDNAVAFERVTVSIDELDGEHGFIDGLIIDTFQYGEHGWEYVQTLRGDAMAEWAEANGLDSSSSYEDIASKVNYYTLGGETATGAYSFDIELNDVYWVETIEDLTMFTEQ